MKDFVKQIIIERAERLANSIQALSNAFHDVEASATQDEINEFITPLFPFNASLDDLWADTEKWVLGMKQTFLTEARAERFAKATENPPVSAVFTIDGSYPCVGVHYPLQRWNGWAVPYFTKEEGLRFVSEFPNDSDVHWSYDEANDQFVCIEDQWKDDPTYTPDTYGAQDVHGQQLYSIGGHSMVWQAEQPKTFTTKDYSGRGYVGETTLIDICANNDNRVDYMQTDEDARSETVIGWALDAEIGDDYDDSNDATIYTRTI